jgi:hypothetical protein
MNRKMSFSGAVRQGACDLAPVRGLLYAAALSIPLWLAAAACVVWVF